MPGEFISNTVFEGYELSYFLTATNYINSYGVGIKSVGFGKEKYAVCFNLTTSRQEALEFLDFLKKTSTFPTVLNDMVEDWLYEKCT